MKSAVLSILAFMTVLASPLFGETSNQKLDAAIVRFVASLQKQQIDTIFIYKFLCPSVRKEIYATQGNENKCSFDGYYVETYIFWKKNEITFVAKKDNCFDYATVPYKIQPSNNFWDYYTENSTIIRQEELKQPHSKILSNGEIDPYQHIIDEKQQIVIEFRIGNNLTTKRFSYLSGQDFIIESGAKFRNVNYPSNRSTKLWILFGQLDDAVQEIDQLETDKKRR